MEGGENNVSSVHQASEMVNFIKKNQKNHQKDAKNIKKITKDNRN
jgi:hypothetical protein